MVVLVLCLSVALVCSWVWLRGALLRHHARPAAPAAPALPPGAAPRPRAHEVSRLPLTEDDVIAFGLALEGTHDVVRPALTDASCAPAEQRVQRDAPGPS